MNVQLNEVERRVLGVLIEKALSQPQYYPMTVNAVVVACNQKSNRDPEMNLDEDTVWNTLEALRERGLAARLLPGGTSRVERWKHEVKEALGWEKPQRAVMAELLLRGPQTVGELRSRCTRMFPFESVEAVGAVLEALSQGVEPMVSPLPRAAGQSAVRYAHRLYSDAEWQQLSRSAGAAAARAAPAPAARPAGPEAPADIRAELAELRAEVRALAAQVAQLQSRLSGSA